MAQTNRTLSMAELAFAMQQRAPELNAELYSQHGHMVLGWGDQETVYCTATVDREAPGRFEVVVYENSFFRPLALRSNLTLDAAVGYARTATKTGETGGVTR